ncbi:MAG: manganese efflux pump, partial [Defluviitaleaceae bacterium]|nr:manganese efflux pump [Defluviitaleaceae bacterium]
SPKITNAVSFGILFTLGLIKIFDSVIKSYIRTRNVSSKKPGLSLFNLKFILNAYADPEKADIDKSRVISPKEALTVAIAVAMDALVLGFGAGLVDVNHLQIIAFSLVLDIIAVISGCAAGGKVAQKVPISLSWLGGVILILLAIF